MAAQNEFERIARMRPRQAAPRTPAPPTRGPLTDANVPTETAGGGGPYTGGIGSDAGPGGGTGSNNGGYTPPYNPKPPVDLGPLVQGSPNIQPSGQTVGLGATGWNRYTKEQAQQQSEDAPTSGALPFYQSPGMRIAGQQISGQGIQDDPAIAAAQEHFRRVSAPLIENQATLAGLGRSTALTNALGQGEAQMLAPMYESAFGRESDRINRMGGAAEQELGRRERSDVRVGEANQNSINQMMQLSEMLYGRRQDTAQNAMQAGAVERGVRQGDLEAQNDDMLRRQALSEQALMTPFGQMMPSAIGSKTLSTGK